MSLVTEVKTDSTTENQMSNNEVASPLSNSESAAVVPQSHGDHRTETEESECHGGVAQNNDGSRIKDAVLGDDVGSCKSQNPQTVEIIKESSGAAADTGKTLAAVSSLEVEQSAKEASIHKEPHCSGVVSSPVLKEDRSAEVKVCDGKGDGQESSVGECGRLNVESDNDKISSVEEEKEKEASEVQPDQGETEKSAVDPLDLVEVIAEDYVSVEETRRESDDDDKDDEDDVLMGYHFNEEEVLVDKNGEKFQFHRHEEHSRNQKRYEKLGEKIDSYVYELLETRCKLKKVYIPLDAKEGEPQSFIFVSEGAFQTDDKLLMLIHGSGVVRAGQWARSLIINHSLRHGTQIPYIERALEDGYEVIVLNTNLNSLSKSRWLSSSELIRGSEDPESHALYVWENVIEKDVKAKAIAIVAHSFGGIVTQDLVTKKHDLFTERVFAIAFTDSVHGLNMVYDSPEVIKFFRDHARNWVTSSLPLDEEINCEKLSSMNDAMRVSAGHEKHEWTSYSSFESIFKFLDKKYRSFISRNNDDLTTQNPVANL